MEFYDVGSGDLRELWESYLAEPALGQDVLMATREEEWGSVLCLKDKASLGVVLRDRLMTDAALGGPRPIKSEHSYSLLTSSPPPSPATPGDNPYTPNCGSFVDSTTSIAVPDAVVSTAVHCKEEALELRSRIDDMEEECFPAISLNTASGRGSGSASPTPTPSSSIPSTSSAPLPSLSRNHQTSTSRLSIATVVPSELRHVALSCSEIKGEPLSRPGTPRTPCNLVNDKNTITMVEPHSLHFFKGGLSQTSDSEEDDEEFYQSMELDDSASLTEAGSSVILHGSRQSLPPTPPSSASSDSESAVSASCSPQRRNSQSSVHAQNLRGLLAPRLYVTNGAHTHTTRQPIHTPLISCQPKGSTGLLTLTEEEKRTLIAEGYPVPTKLPLTKQEEKSLKKVRRKIKNKISAQESRRKKKEYMDGLERRVSLLANENSSYRDRLSALEGTNRELLRELQRLQAMLQAQPSS